jgi:hypothetical protein
MSTWQTIPSFDTSPGRYRYSFHRYDWVSPDAFPQSLPVPKTIGYGALSATLESYVYDRAAGTVTVEVTLGAQTPNPQSAPMLRTEAGYVNAPQTGGTISGYSNVLSTTVSPGGNLPQAEIGTVAMIAILEALTGLLIFGTWLVLDKTEKLVDSPAGASIVSSVSIGMLVVIGAALFFFVKGLKT